MKKLAVFVVVSFVLVSSLLNLSQGKAILIFLSNLSFFLSPQFYRKSWTVDYSNDIYIFTTICKNNVSIFISWIWFYRWWSASLPRTDYCTGHMCPNQLRSKLSSECTSQELLLPTSFCSPKQMWMRCRHLRRR